MQGEHMVSVIIPAYNAQDTLPATLESVRQQTCAPLEVIVVDDGSTDGTAGLVAGAGGPIRYQWQANRGPGAARNQGLALAIGELVAFLDADDLWPSHSLAVLRAHLVERPEVQIVQGYIQDLWPAAEGEETVLGPPRLAFNLGSALFRRSVFAQAGGFDPDLRHGEDIDFWVRAQERGISPLVVKEATLYYRRKLSSRIDDKQEHYSHLLHTLKRSLDRSRERER
jgi:glycosyltransferase involved in cell wall biosynthesis